MKADPSGNTRPSTRRAWNWESRLTGRHFAERRQTHRQCTTSTMLYVTTTHRVQRLTCTWVQKLQFNVGKWREEELLEPSHNNVPSVAHLTPLKNAHYESASSRCWMGQDLKSRKPKFNWVRLQGKPPWPRWYTIMLTLHANLQNKQYCILLQQSVSHWQEHMQYHTSTSLSIRYGPGTAKPALWGKNFKNHFLSDFCTTGSTLPENIRKLTKKLFRVLSSM